MMVYPLTRPAKSPILAALLSPLVEVECHYRKDRGGTVACHGAGCPHCRDGYSPSSKFYGPAAAVDVRIECAVDAELEARIASVRASLDKFAVARGDPAHMALAQELSRLIDRKPRPVESFALAPYPSRDGRFLPRLVVAEVLDTQIGGLCNEPGAVIRWEKKGHTRATYAGAFAGELPPVFAWERSVERLIGVWARDEIEGEERQVLPFRGRKIG